MAVSPSSTKSLTLDQVHARNQELEQALARALAARDEAEQQLNEQRWFHETILNALPVEVAVFDTERRYLYVNEQAVPDSEARSWIIGRTVEEFCQQYGYPLELAEYRQQMFGQAMESGQVVEWDDITPGTEKPRIHHRAFNYVASTEGKPALMLGYGLDITERLAAEREMKKAKEVAEAAARARENFLANMSHEIRTPLNGVLGYANLLAKSSLQPQQKEFVQVIRSSGQHLLGVLNDVLDMAKITSGKMEFEQVAFNLCDSMGQAVQPLALQATQKGLGFYGQPLRMTCPVPWVIGDPHRLNQILINLTANAVKFTDKGSVSVGGFLKSETDTHLTVEFRVTDTGIGIPANKLAHIFEDFNQAYADTTRRFGGTGLGLSISRALVEQLGGTLTVESEEGRGSTFAFSLTLPRATPSKVVEAVSAPESTSNSLRAKRVLLVEDNEINRDVARLFLEGWDMVVDEAVNGLVALTMFEEQHYDIILMDIQMPGMNGMETTAIIRQHADKRKAAVPVLALTANAFQADNERYLAAGMNDCLAKPFDESALEAKLTALLAAAPPKPYDLSQLRASAQGREAFVVKIIRSFLTNIPDSLQGLKEAAAASQWPRIAEIVHHIKPNLAALGITAAEPMVARLEECRHLLGASPAEASEVHATVVELVTLVEQVLEALPEELPQE
ncbi:response regulator [Hymenobacter sp. BT188]|uniref:ATP-binding protein n=1 Tax=Hymenobacter sp. BT188 TaxID=2763504 RepID=UPI00165128E2|nr:ATP-binding protein [Hymenobacter sp. BT188]MBC6608079.1 response regulator [Hymenobacter sp. BT188]